MLGADGSIFCMYVLCSMLTTWWRPSGHRPLGPQRGGVAGYLSGTLEARRTRHKDAHAAALLSVGEGGDDFVNPFQHFVFQPVRGPALQEALQSATTNALATGLTDAACQLAACRLPVA